MIQGPKSLTATVHVRFNYTETELKTDSGGHTQMIAKLLENITELDPDLQELFIKFASYMKVTSTQEPKP